MNTAKIITPITVSVLFSLGLVILGAPTNAQQLDQPDLIQSFPVGDAPVGLVSDGENIWVANYNDNNVMKLRASDGVVLGTFPVKTGPGRLAFDGASIWVACAVGTVTKLRASDGTVEDNVPVGRDPEFITFDGANMWVTNTTDDTVTKIR